jgi:hypothetical protein
LPKLRSTEIKEKAQKGNLDRRTVLEWLWDVVAGPVLDALGFANSTSDDLLPHVRWIPTGALSRFPLHAAGYHEDGSFKTVLDRVMSSYSSSVKTILNTHPAPVTPSTSAHALLVAVDNVPGNTSLPFAGDEVDIVRGLCETMELKPIISDGDKGEMIKYLPQCRIFHFAGHGYTNSEDPLMSYLLLGAGKSDSITVATLLDMNVHEYQPFLAYLSACGTGRINKEEFIDESIHLISACKLAGFRHVIGTLWEVEDEVCLDVARVTYRCMLAGGMTDESVCLGLHEATKTLRDRWLKELSETGDGENLASDVKVHGKEDRTKFRNVSVGNLNQERAILPRDVVFYDEEEEKEKREKIALPWVPYIHFGV